MNFQFENTIEELYSCLPNNRTKFNQIMDSMKIRFLKTDTKSQIKEKSSKLSKAHNKRKSKPFFSYRPSQNSPTKIPELNQLSSKKNEQNMNPNIQNNINNINYRTQRTTFYPQKQEMNMNNINNININKNINDNAHKRSMSNGFKGTLPDALLISPRPLRTNSKQKLLMDTHANCNNFFPERNIFYGNDFDNVGNGWHNQANNIMYHTKENFYFGNK